MATAAASAAPLAIDAKVTPGKATVTQSVVKAKKSAKAAAPCKRQALSFKGLQNGRKAPGLAKLTKNNVINPAALRSKAPRKAEATDNGITYFQSFEEGTIELCGWSVESKATVASPWGLVNNDELADAFGSLQAPDGYQIAFLQYNADALDEWLISPAVTVAQDDQLSFWMYTGVAYFNSLKNVDFDTYEYTSDPVRIGDIEIYAREGEGEWTKIWSMMDSYAGASFLELSNAEIGTKTVSLAAYVGKTVQFAFRYWGTDCDSAMLDAVKIGKPSLEGVSILEPFEMLYWGCDRSTDWYIFNTPLALAPVEGPLTWTNFSDYVEGATYTWTYDDPETFESVTAEDGDDGLTVTYHPDFYDEETCRNNIYSAPVLTGIAPGASPASDTRGYSFLQAGGKAEFPVTDLTGASYMAEYGLLPYVWNLEGATVLQIDDETIGDPAIPVFGHNANTDKYWLNYTYDGETPKEGDEVKLTGYLNFIYAPSSPLVVTGVHTLALGQISAAAKFRCDFYVLNDDGTIDDANIFATAYSEGDKVMVDEGTTNDFLTICFDFDEPVILDNVKGSAYVVKISGFNSSEVTYFAPVQSDIPDPNGMCFGYVEKWLNITGFDPCSSYMPIANVDGKHGPCYNAFCINLEGYYPFMVCDQTEAEVHEGKPVQISLGSYYNGADLTIDAPDGITATAAGRYDNCLLTLNATKDVEGIVTVSAPGVKKKIKVKGTSGIIDIKADSDAAVTDIYTIDGRKVNAAQAQQGIYILRRADGTTAKARIR